MALRKEKLLLVIIFTSVVWCSVAILLSHFAAGFIQGINSILLDRKISLTSLPATSSEIVHLDVDDKAIEKIGEWPWDRGESARIVRRLAELGAKVVVFDIIYSKAKGARGDQAFFDAIKDTGIVVSAASFKVTESRDEKLFIGDDRQRVEALYDRAWSMSVPAKQRLVRVVGFLSTLLPLSPILHDSKEIGHILSTPDADGVFRRVPLLVQLEDRLVPSLSLAALAAYMDLKPDSVSFNTEGYVEIRRDGKVTRIPVDGHGMMLVNWGEIWRTFKSYSVVDILSDKADPSRVSPYKDKIVIVGATSSGLTDLGTTPRGLKYPLSRLHSNAMNTILKRAFINELRAFPYLVAVTVLLSIVFSYAAAKMPLKWGIAVGLFACFAFVATSVLGMSVLACEIPVAEILLIFGPCAAISVAIRALTIEVDASRSAKALQRYLSEEMLGKILSRDEEVDLSTKRLELTVLFADIEGFSTISETAEVEYVNEFLNDFFDRMTGAVFKYHGTVDKFLGDGLLAFFGEPVTLDSHATAAVRAALDMQREMKELNAKWGRSGIQELQKGIHIRIGINTGPVVVGNIGSRRRMEYTIVGSAVNIACRLQGEAPPGGILITARTRALTEDSIALDGPKTKRVKGIARTLEVYQVNPPQLA